MTKAKISEYDAVASNNTDVNGVNIAEGCPPSGMNNMGREIMAALKRFQVGSDSDGVTVGGNLVVSGTSTVNTFTAGPVSATTLNTSGAVVFNDAGADVDFRVEGDTEPNLLFVDASADAIGIGTSSPVSYSDYYGLTIQDTTGGFVHLRNAANSHQAELGLNGGAGSAYLATYTSTPIQFITNNTERMRIDTSGNLLVGTTSAAGRFSIEYSGGSVVGQNINDSDNTNNSTLVQFQIQGTQVGTIKRVGTTSAVIYNTSSDYRLKTVIGAVTGHGARIDALKPIVFQWKEGGQQAKGFLAHEFQEVYESSVSGDKDALDANGNPVYQTMQASTSEVIADLVAELQSLRARVAALESN